MSSVIYSLLEMTSNNDPMYSFPSSNQYPYTNPFTPPTYPSNYQYPSGAYYLPPPRTAVPFPAPYEQHHVMGMDPSARAFVGAWYPSCGYCAPIMEIDVHIKKETLKIVPDQEDPEKFLVEFTFDAFVACSITLSVFEELGEDMSPTIEDLLPSITVDFPQGFGQKFRQKSGTGIDLSLYRVNDYTEVYHLQIKAQESRCISEDGSMVSGSIISQFTLAEFEKEKDECQVRVTSQFLKVNNVEYDIGGCGIYFWNDPGEQYRKIGKLLVSNIKIGMGSSGTIVFKGSYDDREVAVKRIVKEHYDVAMNEIANLNACDWHPNIVRYYGVEKDQDFVYVALEKCVCSLHDLILSHGNLGVQLEPTTDVFKDLKLWKPNGYPSSTLLNLMRDTVRGLAHLHELKIIHRDLKPQNVLIQKYTYICAMVSDMGISRRLAADKSSLTKSTTGSTGWKAPERLRNERQRRSGDLFSLGCLFSFCITGGKHPYGDAIERDINILNGKRYLSSVEKIPEAFDLISRLLDPDAESRPKATEVYNHPLFWDPEKRISFLRDSSDHVEPQNTDSNLRKSLEDIKHYKDWNQKLDETLITDIKRWRAYNYNSVRCLLRAIRNIYCHYGNLSKASQMLFKNDPTEVDGYFSHRFSKLLMDVYEVLKKNCVEGQIHDKYYKQYQF